MQELVAYKPLTYKPTTTPPSKPLYQAIYFPPGQTDSPNLHRHIAKQLLNFTFCKSQTNKVSVALEPWRVEGWSSQGFVISAFSAGGEGVCRIWEVSVPTSKNIGWFDMELPYYYSLLLHYYYIYVNFSLYFENKEKFCFCVWLQICSTYCNLIYCIFITFCDLILSVVLQSFPYWGYTGSPPTTSRNVAPPHHRKSIHPRAQTHTNTHTHTRTYTHTYTK